MCWRGRRAVLAPVPCPLPLNLVDTATTVPEVDVASDTLVVTQVCDIIIYDDTYNKILMPQIHASACLTSAETEKFLTSPSTPSTSSTTPVTSPPSHLYYSHSWIPHNIEISLDESGDMSVRKIGESRNNDSSATRARVMENGQDDNKIQIVSEKVSGSNADSEDGAENCKIPSCTVDGEGMISTNPEVPLVNAQKVQYSLSAVVCYIDDKNNEERRNIVALLRVGPNYHVRSSGNAVSQWYIFNDFW